LLDIFLKSSYAEFHENPTNGLTGDSSSQQTRGRRSYFLRKELHDRVVVTVLIDSPSTPRQCHSAFATEFHCEVPRSDVTTFVIFLRNRFCECTGLMEATT
jgi:hypothetical protein